MGFRPYGPKSHVFRETEVWHRHGGGYGWFDLMLHSKSNPRSYKGEVPNTLFFW